MQEPFKVCVRVKPYDGRPRYHIQRQGQETVCQIECPSDPPECRLFSFDNVFNGETTKEIYGIQIQSMISDCVNQGYNGTILAYGQTGSGKSFTMFGNLYDGDVIDDGIVSLVLQQLFEMQMTVSVSYLEIYNESIRDLIGDQQNLNLVEDKQVIVQDAEELEVHSLDQAKHVIWSGNQKRVMAATSGNNQSSRSHAIIQLFITNGSYQSKISLVDLAGSERGYDNVKGIRQVEGANINRSLLTLGNCINTLADPKQHKFVPYRDSKLTRLLKDSLGGNTKTLMIACVQQALICHEESINTLKYASRARAIKKKITQNIFIKNDTDVNQEIQQLKQMLINFQHNKEEDHEIDSNLKQIDFLQNANKAGLNDRLRMLEIDPLNRSVQMEIQEFEKAINENDKIRNQLLSQKARRSDPKDQQIDLLKREVQYLRDQLQIKDQIIHQLQINQRPQTSQQETTDRSKRKHEFSIDFDVKKESLHYCASSKSIKPEEDLIQLNKARESFKMLRSKLVEVRQKIQQYIEQGQFPQDQLKHITDIISELHANKFKLSSQDQELIIQFQLLISAKQQQAQQQNRSRSMNTNSVRGKVVSTHVRKPLQVVNQSPISRAQPTKLSQLVQKSRKVKKFKSTKDSIQVIQGKYILKYEIGALLRQKTPRHSVSDSDKQYFPLIRIEEKTTPVPKVVYSTLSNPSNNEYFMKSIKYTFAFFSKPLIQKPSKCCRYNQDGKPLKPAQVLEIYNSTKELLEGWKVTDLRLFRYFYTEDYLSGIQFIREVAKIDALSTKNCPSFDYQKGEILTIQLYSPTLDGLSPVDFDLAIRINQIDLSQFYLIPLNSLENYRQQVQAYRLKKQSKMIQEELKQMQ